MSSWAALNSNQLTKIVIGATIVLFVVGLLLSLVITAIVGRLILLVVVAALGVLIWQQRAAIEQDVNRCQLNMSFLGVHVQAPRDVVTRCEAAHRLSR